MAAGFDRTSLSISLDCGPDEFLSNVQQRRVYEHERLHLWQTLSQGFMARQALLEWERLQRFEETGEVAASLQFNGQLNKFFEKEPTWGFSAWNLSEALARFWDIQSIGASRILAQLGKAQEVPPHEPGFSDTLLKLQATDPGWGAQTSENFDHLMQLEDWYAAPYRMALQRLGSLWAAVFFPLLAHFSLQTRSPAEVFAEATSRLCLTVQLATKRKIYPLGAPRPDLDFSVLVSLVANPAQAELFLDKGRGLLDTMWPLFTPVALSLCHAAAVDKCGGISMETGWDVIDDTRLKNHPVYRYFIALLMSVVHLSEEEFRARFPNIPPFISFQSAFALPGSLWGKFILERSFIPPLVMFRDDTCDFWTLYVQQTPETERQGAFVKAFQAAGYAVANDSLWVLGLRRRFEKARILAGLGSGD